MHPSVHCNTIYSSRTWKKPKCPLVDGWIKKMYCVCPWKKSYDQPRQHIEKQRHYFANKSPFSHGYGFVVMYGCESWTIKKAEHQRIDGFELWCWRRLLRALGLQGDPTSSS